MNSHGVFIHIHQGCFAGTGAIVRLPQCQWSKPDGYGKISQCITTTKHSKAKTVCILLGMYCIVDTPFMTFYRLLEWIRNAYQYYSFSAIQDFNMPVNITLHDKECCHDQLQRSKIIGMHGHCFLSILRHMFYICNVDWINQSGRMVLFWTQKSCKVSAVDPSSNDVFSNICVIMPRLPIWLSFVNHILQQGFIILIVSDFFTL